MFSIFFSLLQPILAWNEATTIFFNFFNFLDILLEFSIMCRAGTERNGTITFIFLLSHPFPTYFGLKWILNDILSFLQFFCYFFLIFYYASGRNEMERKFLFSSFLGLFQPTLAWNEAIIVFLNFLNFFPIFLKFSTSRRVGTKQNGNFYFPSFEAFSNLFWLKMNP